MRFFVLACLFCLIVASVGCMTQNWSSPLFKTDVAADDETEEYKPSFWKSKFGEGSGIDPRAREIEKRLGL